MWLLFEFYLSTDIDNIKLIILRVLRLMKVIVLCHLRILQKNKTPDVVTSEESKFPFLFMPMVTTAITLLFIKAFSQ